MPSSPSIASRWLGTSEQETRWLPGKKSQNSLWPARSTVPVVNSGACESTPHSFFRSLSPQSRNRESRSYSNGHNTPSAQPQKACKRMHCGTVFLGRDEYFLRFREEAMTCCIHDVMTLGKSRLRLQVERCGCGRRVPID